MLCGSQSLAESLGAERLEALARLVRELCENACHHGHTTVPGRLTGDLSAATFELHLGGPAFDSVARAAILESGGLYSSGAVLARAGGTWTYRYQPGWNIFEIRFDGAVPTKGATDELAERAQD
jgi:hypothetical protein